MIYSSHVYSATYWVSPIGVASWINASSDTPLNGTSACSLGVANANAVAGDIIYLRAGLYTNQYIQPSNSGTSENSRIIYRNYNNGIENEIVTLTDALYAILLENKSYISVIGINFYYMDHFVFIRNDSNHNTISYCTFERAKYTDTWSGSIIYNSSQYNWIHHCTFAKWGFADGTGSTDHSGAMLDVGIISTADDSYYNLIEENTLYYGGHHFIGIWSKYSVFRNNYMHHESSTVDSVNYGYRCSITHGIAVDRNLIQGNRYGFSDNAAGFALRSSNNIIRFNMFYNNGLGGIQTWSMNDTFTPADGNHIYNNVFYNNGYEAVDADFAGGLYFMNSGYGSPIGNRVKNNIFYANAGGAITYNGTIESQIILNNWEEIGDPLFIYDGSNLNSLVLQSDFNLGVQPDFHLQVSSPCINNAGFLTEIVSDTGSGTQIKVNDAGYFVDGWGIIEGDIIQLQNSTQRVKVISVNYELNTLDLDRIIVWTEGQGVALAYEGSNPDQGAYEYGLNNLSVSDHNMNNAIIYVYPNPAKQISPNIRVNIEEQDSIEIIVYDLSGEKIDLAVETPYSGAFYEYKCETIKASGVYIVVFKGTKGSSITTTNVKFIVVK
jgi:hypothetical protein